MSDDDILSTQTPHDAQSWQNALGELQVLLAKPLYVDTGITRAGKVVGLRITPVSSQAQTQLVVRFFPARLAPAEGDEESQADQVALRMFLDGLHAPDLATRLAACEALGQLGNLAARSALTSAEQDENWLIRTAARKAIHALATPHIKMADLSDIPLILWQHVKHVWKPVGTTKTDRQGEARFANVSLRAVYRLQLLQTQHSTLQPALVLGTRRSTKAEFLPEALAAESGETDVNTLPQSHRVVLEDGSLVSTVVSNEEELVIIEFRTDSSRLRDGWVHCRITHRETRQNILSALVELTPNTRGILSGRLLLGEEIDGTQVYELHFEPVPAPTWDR